MRRTHIKQTVTVLAALMCCLILSGCSYMLKGTPYDEMTYETFIVLEVSDSRLILAEIGEGGAAIETMQYSVPNLFDENTHIQVHDKIKIEHSGEILESYPMQFARIYKMEYIDANGMVTVIHVD